MKEKSSKIAKLNKEYSNVLKQDYSLSPMLLALGLVKPGSTVLSIGCGGGREVKYLVKKLNCKVTGIDYDPEMIKSSEELEPNAEYYCVDALDFVRREKFDYIVCLWNTINFLSKKERKKLIRISYTNLKEEGKLILATSHLFQHWRFPLHNLKHRTNYYYFPSEIKWWFKDSKFNVEKIKVGRSNLIVARKEHRLN